MTTFLVQPEWDTDGKPIDECGLPLQIIVSECPDVPDDILEEQIADLVSDCFGYCHTGIEFEELKSGAYNASTGEDIIGYLVFPKDQVYDGSRCPSCGSEHINGNEIEPIGADRFCRNCDCGECGSTWTEEAVVSGYDHLTEAS